MKIIIKVVFAVFLLIFLSNCGTIRTLSLANPGNIEGPISARELAYRSTNYDCANPTEDMNIPYVYSGVKSDIRHITWASKCGWASGETGFVNNAFYMFSIPFVVIDIPFSFVADTVMLPSTIPKQNKEGYLLDPPYFKLGNIQMSKGNKSKAIEYYKKGLEILPKYYSKIKFYEIYSYVPDFDDAIKIIAENYEQQSDYTKAIYYFEVLIDIALNYQDGPSGPADKRFDDLARVYSKMGNADKSSEYYIKADNYRQKYNKTDSKINEHHDLKIIPMNQ